ncbi:MAG TPA: ribosome biogenesis GTPase YlqF [Oscillospiraceae bacterium]|nr:ribosome biogenesis GTPase YlqF [Oscillospiraceae bacterium]
MSEPLSINWFPGHMAKTRRLITESLPLVDIVIELVDARIPQSSRNPILDELIAGKPRVLLLNKSDAADADANNRWLEHFKSKGITCMTADCRSGKGLNSLMPLVKSQLTEVLERRAARGMSGQPLRMMIVGIPNVGKSSLINRLAGSQRTKVEDRPGVTRGKQWVTVDRQVELLDMPGVLWPKFEDKIVGERLAFTGAIKDDILDIEALAMRLLLFLNEQYHLALKERYKMDMPLDTQGLDLLNELGKKRGMLVRGGEVDTERAAIAILDEFRSGKLGRITLELPKKQA